MGVEIQGIRQATSTFGDYWLPRSSRWFKFMDRGTSCITPWKKFVFHGNRSESVLQGDVKNAFLQGTFDDNVVNGELATEPVPELCKALNLREDEIVVLTKACYGLIDAPRRWWKSLVRDTQQLGWRSCRHEPCLMTWHVRGKLMGLMCFHVGDIMISGRKKDPEFKRMMDRVKSLYEWGEWERNEFDQPHIRQATDKSVTVDQESLRSEDWPHHNVCTPTQTHDRNLV